MRRTASLLLAVSSLLLLLSSANARTRPRQGGTLRMEMRADAAQWMNSAARMLVFDTLTELESNGNLKASLAARWESQSDDRRWQVWLRPGISFQDGTPLSAATVVQSLTAQECGGCPWKTVHVSGDSVVFESEAPVPNLPAMLSNSRYAITRRDDGNNPVGTGAFRFGGLASGVLTLKAVEDSWRPRAYVNAIEIRGGRSLREQWMDAGAGRADVVEVPAELLRRAQQEHMGLVSSRNCDLVTLVVDDKDPAAQEMRLREALALSLDRASLWNVVFQKQGEVTASVLPNWLTGYSFAFDAAANLTRAKELRAQISRPPEWTLSVDSSDPVLQLIAERLVLNAKDAGLNLRMVAGTGHTTLRLIRAHIEETDLAAAFVDAADQLGQSEQAPADNVVAVFHQEQVLLAKRSVIPLLYLPRSFAFSTRVHDLMLASDGNLHSADFWLEDGK